MKLLIFTTGLALGILGATAVSQSVSWSVSQDRLSFIEEELVEAKASARVAELNTTKILDNQQVCIPILRPAK